MARALHFFSTAATALALSTPVAWAQGTGQPVNLWNTPYPALQQAISSATRVQGASTDSQEPDRQAAYTPALSGAEEYIPGSSGLPRSFFVLAASFYEWVDTNPYTVAHPGGTVALSSIVSSLALRRSSGRFESTINYEGGGTVANNQATSSRTTGLNSIIQRLEASQTVRWRRWALLMRDQFSYLPEASFGSFQGNLNDLDCAIGGSFGEGYPGLQSFLTPSQSVLTGPGGRISNTFLTKGDYQLNSRSSITTAGAYELLHFFDSGLFDSSNTILMTGYNYRITSADTLAIIYRFAAFRFSGVNRAIDDHVAQLSYGRRITGRLSLRLAGGPYVELFRSAGGASQQRVLWSLESALHYRLLRTALDLSYQQGQTGGAGILAGAETRQIGATATQNLSRIWQASFWLGYANNRSISTNAISPSNRALNTWYSRVQFSRAIGRSVDLVLGYVGQWQGSNAPICAGPTCVGSLVRHQIFLGFDLHRRPIAID